MIEPVNGLVLPRTEAAKHNCEVCKKEGFGHQWMEPGNYWLCLACKARIELRGAQAKRAEKAAEKEPRPAVIVDEAELKGLKADGLLSLRTYIYLALRIGGVTKELKNVEIDRFCRQWQICREDFIAAIAGLSKKGIVELNIEKLSARAFTQKERIESMEESVNGSN